jgi:two-component system heavy metal sensor histidine kinase CusS
MVLLPRPGSIRTRLTLMLGGIAVMIFSAAGVLMHQTLAHNLQRQEAKELSSKVDIVQHLVSEVSRPEQLGDLSRKLDDIILGSGNLHIRIALNDGRLVHGGKDFPVILERAGDSVSVLGEDGVRLAGRQLRLAAPGILAGATVTIAIDMRAHQQLLHAHDFALLLISGIGVSITIALSALAAHRGLAPVAALSAQASRITPEAMSVRLPLDQADRELKSLVLAFNQVLDRLAEAYEQMEGFNADVAHELRTPLAVLINGTQIALSSERPTYELRETLVSNLEELEHMKRLINDMLFLAQADKGQTAEEMASISLAAEARGVAEYVEAVLEERHIRLNIEGDATARGSGRLLRRALLNLVSNALRYTADSGTVTIRIARVDAGVRVSVRNAGEPIAPQDLPRIFDRFYRTDSARGARGERLGLGLAIVRAIARMHGGRTFASSEHGITEVGFEF